MVLEKNLPLTKERNYGVDLLRIVAMFMVLFLHILGNGGILFEVKVLSPHGIVAWFFEMATFSAINCYGVISGYVSVNARYKYSNLALLWLQVAGYSFIITLIYHLRYPLAIPFSSVTEALSPVSYKLYWYVTAYVGMFLLIPILNRAALSFTKKQFKTTLIILFVALSVLPALYEEDIFTTAWGYSTIWLCFLYLIGAYIKLHGFFKNSIKISLVIYTMCTLFSWLVKLWEESVSTEGKYADLATGFIAQYTSPTVLLSGVALFVVFSQLKLPKFSHTLIKIISPCAFGVYIIHAHPLLWDRLITYRYASFINHNPLVMMLLVFLVALCMFVAFSFVDFIRLLIFRILHLKPLLEKAEKKLIKDLWN